MNEEGDWGEQVDEEKGASKPPEAVGDAYQKLGNKDEVDRVVIPGDIGADNSTLAMEVEAFFRDEMD